MSIHAEVESLEQKVTSWKVSRKSGKFVELCFKLGQAYTKAVQRKKAIIAYQQGITIAHEINFKMTFEQMIEYGKLLLEGEDSNEISFANFI